VKEEAEGFGKTWIRPHARIHGGNGEDGTTEVLSLVMTMYVVVRFLLEGLLGGPYRISSE